MLLLTGQRLIATSVPTRCYETTDRSIHETLNSLLRSHIALRHLALNSHYFRGIGNRMPTGAGSPHPLLRHRLWGDRLYLARDHAGSADLSLWHLRDRRRGGAIAAFNNVPGFKELWAENPIKPSRATATGRAILECRVVHIPDVLADPEYDPPEGALKQAQRMGNYRTVLVVPMLREGVPLGMITLWKTQVQPFAENQIELVKTFADQAVIAIENAFNPFFTTKPGGEGTGLGLSITHDIIVKQHAGSIEVDTQPGEFTEIRIILPRTATFIAESGGRA